MDDVHTADWLLNYLGYVQAFGLYYTGLALWLFWEKLVPLSRHYVI